MNNTIIFYAIVSVLFGFIVWDKLMPRIKSLFVKKSASTQAMIDLTAGLNEFIKVWSNPTSDQEMLDLRAAIDRLTTALNSDESTKMLAGTLKACEAIATATVELRDEVAAFGKLVRIDDKPYPADEITQPDKSKDEMVATFLDALTRGRSVQEAQQQSKDDAETKTMFSAVTMDPMGGE